MNLLFINEKKCFPIIEMDTIILRNLELGDTTAYFRYVSDEDIKNKFRFDFNETTARKRLYSLVKRYASDNPPKVWAIAPKKTFELAGIISIDDYSVPNKSVSLACGIISEYRNFGYATEATIGVINYLFKKEDIYRVQLAHTEGHKIAKRCFEKIGVTHEGLARGKKFEGGKFVNSEIYAVLNGENQYANMPCKLLNNGPTKKLIK